MRMYFKSVSSCAPSITFSECSGSVQSILAITSMQMLLIQNDQRSHASRAYMPSWASCFPPCKTVESFFVHVEFCLAPDTYIITSKENFVKLCFPFPLFHSTAH